MHELLPETDAAFVALRLKGKLDEVDYRDIVPILESRSNPFFYKSPP